MKVPCIKGIVQKLRHLFFLQNYPPIVIFAMFFAKNSPLGILLKNIVIFLALRNSMKEKKIPCAPPSFSSSFLTISDPCEYFFLRGNGQKTCQIFVFKYWTLQTSKLYKSIYFWKDLVKRIVNIQFVSI